MTNESLFLYANITYEVNSSEDVHPGALLDQRITFKVQDGTLHVAIEDRGFVSTGIKCQTLPTSLRSIGAKVLAQYVQKLHKGDSVKNTTVTWID